MITYFQSSTYKMCCDGFHVKLHVFIGVTHKQNIMLQILNDQKTPEFPLL